MQNVTNTAPGAAGPGSKKSLKERAISELEKYVIICVYLGVLFFLFNLHRQLLQGHGISLWSQGFAIINALIFGKVILIGEALKLGERQESRPLGWVVLCKALFFAILLVAFHLLEEAIRAWFEGHPLSAAVTNSGGSWVAVAAYTGIIFVVLIPFYAFHEAARVLGANALWDLFFRSHADRIPLAAGQAIGS
jgi:hypothetical protein